MDFGGDGHGNNVVMFHGENGTTCDDAHLGIHSLCMRIVHSHVATHFNRGLRKQQKFILGSVAGWNNQEDVSTVLPRVATQQQSFQ